LFGEKFAFEVVEGIQIYSWEEGPLLEEEMWEVLEEVLGEVLLGARFELVTFVLCAFFYFA